MAIYCLHNRAFRAVAPNAQQMIVVNVVDEPDVINAIAVQIELKKRCKTDTWNQTGPRLSCPDLFAGTCVDGNLHAIIWREEHLHIGIYFGILAIGKRNANRWLATDGRPSDMMIV